MEAVEIVRPRPLLEGRLVRRYKRFLADVELDDIGLVTAHCVNTGAMEGLTAPGNRVWLSRADNPDRKLKFTWELVEVDGQVIGANTAVPNQVVGHLLRAGSIPWLAGYDTVRPEQRYGTNSRIDFLLEKGTRRLFLEVKNCHLVYPDNRAYFPDSVSARAAAHLEELATVADTKTRAHVLFFCQVPAAKALRPSDLHDPAFAATARRVAREGVRFSALSVAQYPDRTVVQGRIPVELRPYSTRRIAKWLAANKN